MILSRVSDLPDATRLVLLVAALNDEDSTSETLRASSAVAGTTLGLDVVAPAAEAGIVGLDLQRLRLRHPLVRSAIARAQVWRTVGGPTTHWRMCSKIQTGGRGTGRLYLPASTRTSHRNSK